MDFKINKELLQQIMDYFATRPWGEANPYLLALSKLPKLESQAPVLAPVPAPAPEKASESK